ncbi:MAG: hypothetical protein Q4B70_13820, partial [Lachnospiraceae bacterium]|nr:hypothetical protein [Lachnospiraceae bacterium]
IKSYTKAKNANEVIYGQHKTDPPFIDFPKDFYVNWAITPRWRLTAYRYGSTWVPKNLKTL